MNSIKKIHWQLGLLRLNFFSLMVFEVLYKAFGTYCFFPFLIFMIRRLITGVGEDLITNENLKLFISSPYNILVLSVCILLIAYYFLIEICVLCQGFKSSTQKKSSYSFGLFLKGFKSSWRFFHPKNWIAFIIVFAFLPFLHFGLTSGIAQFLYAETMIKLQWGVIVSRALLAGTLLIMGLISLFLSFAFVFFIQYEVNFLTSCYMSLMTYRKNFWPTLLKMLRIIFSILAIALIGFIVLALLSLIVYEALLIGTGSDAATASTQLFRRLVEIVSPMVALYFLLYSILGTTCYFSGVYGLLYYSKNKEEVSTESTYRPKRYLTALLLTVLIGFYSVFQGAVMAANISNDSLLVAQTGGILTGHRGNMKEEVENTQASFDNAIANGAEYIELDVRRSQDNVLVVCHDTSLSHLTGKYLTIEETPYSKMKDLLMRYEGNTDTTPNQHLLTLDEAIKNCKDKARLNIELKTVKNSDGYVQQVIDTVKNNGIENSCFLASGNYEYIKEIEAIDSSLNTLFLTESNYGDIENLIADGLSLQMNAVNPDTVKRIHLKGKMVHAWILETEEQIQRMIDMGVDYLITNDVRMGQVALANNRPNQMEQLESVFMNILIQS